MFNELGTLLAWDEYTGGSGINRNVQKFRALDTKVSVILGNETGVKFAPTMSMPAQEHHRYTASPSQTDPPTVM